MAEQPSTLPILYSFRRCPYAMRARMALRVSETQCELREVLLAHKPDAMLEASPKGTVPVLQLPDGEVIDESLAVMDWALARNDPDDWIAHQGGDAEALIEANDGPFKHHLDRYKYHTRYGEECDPEEHRAAAAEILLGLNARLKRHAFLCSDQPSRTDYAIFPFIRQFASTDRAWFDAQDWPALRRWLDGLIESDLFKAIMPKRDPWRPDDAVTLFIEESRPANSG